MIQQLTYGEENYYIGLSEILNTNSLNTKKLLDLATSCSTDVLVVQFFDSALISNETHLLSAAQNAINAWRGDYMISRSLDVEIIVYASAQRQIHQALSMFGVRDGLDTVAVVIIDRNEKNVLDVLSTIIDALGQEQLPSFAPSLEKIGTLMKTFDISENEMQNFITTDTLSDRIQALSRCIASRVSLVAIGA